MSPPKRPTTANLGSMPSISFPFRVNPASRAVATNPDGSDPEVNEAIAVHVMTHPGERPLRPGLGTESLPFSDGLDPGALQLQLTEYGWEHITVTNVESGQPANGRVETAVTWERNA